MTLFLQVLLLSLCCFSRINGAPQAKTTKTSPTKNSQQKKTSPPLSNSLHASSLIPSSDKDAINYKTINFESIILGDLQKNLQSPTPTGVWKNVIPANFKQDTKTQNVTSSNLSLTATDDTYTFTFTKLPGSALLKIADDYWLFFDKATPAIPLPEKIPIGIKSIVRESHPAFTIYRLNIEHEYSPALDVQKNGVWNLQISSPAKLTRGKSTIAWPNHPYGSVKLSLPLFGQEIVWTHPITQMTYYIYTSKSSNRVFMTHQDFPGFTIMQTINGIALYPKTDDLLVQTFMGDLFIFAADGLIFPEYVLKNFDSSFAFLADRRSNSAIMSEISKINEKTKPAAKDLFLLALDYLKLGVWDNAEASLNRLNMLCDNKKINFKAHIDFLKTVISAISPRKRVAEQPEPLIGHHYNQSLEFDFWVNFKNNTVQNYKTAIDQFIKDYPENLKALIVAHVLYKGIGFQNLLEITQTGDFPKDLMMKSRLRLALIPPIDKKALDNIINDETFPRELRASSLIAVLQAENPKNINIDDAIKKLEGFIFSFGEQEVEAKMLLGRYYQQKKKYVSAIKVYESLLTGYGGKFPEIRQNIKEAFLNFFKEALEIYEKKDVEQKGENPILPLDIVSFYLDYSHLIPEGDLGKKMLLVVIQAMKQLNLYKQALEIIGRGLEEDPLSAYANNLYLEQSNCHFLLGDFQKAETSLGSLTNELSSEQQIQKTLMEINIAIERGDIKKGLELIGDRNDVPLLRKKHEIFWKQSDWENLVTFLPGLIEKELQAKKPELIVHLVAANCLCDHPKAVKELRDQYAETMKDTPENDIFLVLTDEKFIKENGLKDLTSVTDLITYLKKLPDQQPPVRD